MKPLICFVGSDRRTPWARAYLEARGYGLGELSSPELTHVFLPVPGVDAAGRIVGGPPLAELLPRLRPGLTVAGGKLDQCRPSLAATGAAIYDFMEDAYLTAANAAVTAEGALELALEHMTVTLEGTEVLVIGWGRIGKLLSHKLAAMGARVTVSARNPNDLAMLRAFGYDTLPTGALGNLSRFRVIFNTVPAPVLTARQLRQTSPDCLCMDLASAPGGLEIDGSRNVLIAAGLPGKTAPETAGRLLGEAMERLLMGEEA
ncbi:MAG: hypothetical protein SOY32_04175 [Candidatus Faecousia sp.]|nr:hypothetical protein [Clostridiales bacterium]MDD7652696.1 hypothetical protein [Bacillota bacterium]MDY4219599.1 hypothetical protein [Candidatus Faecousia sp.]